MNFKELLIACGVDPQAAQGNPELRGVATLEAAVTGDLAFLENPKFVTQLQQTGASAVLIPDQPSLVAIATKRQISYYVTPQPRLLFATAMAIFYPPQRLPSGIHPTAVIAADGTMGDRVALGPHVVLGSGVTLGDDVQIHANVVVGDRVTIGDRTILYANCTIHAHSVIGQDCVIHSGAVIGSEGFGFVPTSTGQWQKMPQIGRTVLEDGVEVGCNSTIDRGAIGDTHIGRGTKIDNLVQIAHGCTTGADCLMAGQVGLSGGVQLGRNVVLAGQVGVANHLKLGDRVQVGAKSGVMDHLPAGQFFGIPALPAKEFFKAFALFKRLPELYKLIKHPPLP
ncbi:MAG: UDP-3-O-(3-hydroxymyristoyl)glucosamine N-acyltransferase [Oscillatoriales cyanobacterium SM2_2_1]|nr:UDP-3-O-(3-hydroxymyristoyl)glucosamine N-acyltransferase [Oscillatoriales cyanobacterium SM2_2_1]